MFRRKRQQEYRRAVGTHYGPTRMNWAYTATMIHGPHYKPDCGPCYELHYDPRYMPSYTAMLAGPTTATEPPRRWTCRRTTLDTYIWRSRPRPWCLQPGVMTTTAGLLGIGRGLLKSATPLDWTTRAALSDYADRRRRSGAGLTRVGTGRRRRLLQPDP